LAATAGEAATDSEEQPECFQAAVLTEHQAEREQPPQIFVLAAVAAAVDVVLKERMMVG
jgi:hypothetical protein